MHAYPPSHLWYQFLLLTSYSHYASASATVLDIVDLLHTREQQLLHSPNPTSPWSPWSHKPYCTHSTAPQAVGQKFCVYTSNVTGPNGISIISTPHAARNAGHYLTDDPLANFLTQEQAESLYYHPPPYKIVPVAGKDMGVVSTRKIERFETFMVDQAAVVVDMELDGRVSSEQNLAMLKVAVERLRMPGLVSGLSSKHSREGRGTGGGAEVEGRAEEDVMMTNSFATTIAGTPSRVLFPLVSRINHACNPNSFVLFSESGVSIAIKAYRNMEPGEEVTISYLLLGQPYTKRQSSLQRWGFSCTCELCRLPEQKRIASDIRRELISASEKKIMEFWKQGKIHAAIDIAKESVEMIKEEDIWPMLTDEYAMLAKLYLLLEDRESAEEYGRKSYELLERLGFLGNEADEEWSLEKLLKTLAERGMYD